MRAAASSSSLLRRWLALRAQHQDPAQQALAVLGLQPPSSQAASAAETPLLPPPLPTTAAAAGWPLLLPQQQQQHQLRAYAPRRPFLRSGSPPRRREDFSLGGGRGDEDEDDDDDDENDDRTDRRRCPPSGNSNPEAELTRRVRAATTPEALLRLLRREGRSFNHIHVAATMQQAATLGAREQQQSQFRGEAWRSGGGGGGGGGRADQKQQPPTAAKMAALVARLADGPFRRALPQYGAREAAAGLGALARLREPAPPGLVDAVARELLAWGKVGASAAAVSEGGHAEREGGPRGSASSNRRRPHQELAELAWALARLHQLARGGAPDGNGSDAGALTATTTTATPDWATQRACERLLRHAARALAAPGALERMAPRDAAMAAFAVAAVLPSPLQARVVEVGGGGGGNRRSRAASSNNAGNDDDDDYDLDAPLDFARALGEALARGGRSPDSSTTTEEQQAAASDQQQQQQSWASPGPRAVVSFAGALRALGAPGPEAVEALERVALLEAPRMKPRELLATVRALRGLRRQWPLLQQRGEEAADADADAPAPAPASPPPRFSSAQVELAVLFGERCFLGKQAQRIQASDPAVVKGAATALAQAAASVAAAAGDSNDPPLARRLEAALEASALVVVAERGGNDEDADELTPSPTQTQQQLQQREETV